MGWLSKLFGASENNTTAKKGPSEEHEGFVITPMPESRGGQFLTVGEISSTDPADERVHRFIRADMNPSFEQACQHTIIKAKQIIAERGISILDEKT